MDIQQLKMAESILPTAQRAFEYFLDRTRDPVEETEEYTRVRVGNLYDLIVGESEGVLVSSLTVSVRGELIKVRGENLVLAQGMALHNRSMLSIARPPGTNIFQLVIGTVLCFK
jgi:hypothetical protein